MPPHYLIPGPCGTSAVGHFDIPRTSTTASANDANGHHAVQYLYVEAPHQRRQGLSTSTAAGVDDSGEFWTDTTSTYHGIQGSPTQTSASMVTEVPSGSSRITDPSSNSSIAAASVVSIGAIIGIVFACIGFLAVIVGVVVLILRRKRKLAQRAKQESQMPFNIDGPDAHVEPYYDPYVPAALLATRDTGQVSSRPASTTGTAATSGGSPTALSNPYSPVSPSTRALQPTPSGVAGNSGAASTSGTGTSSGRKGSGSNGAVHISREEEELKRNPALYSSASASTASARNAKGSKTTPYAAGSEARPGATNDTEGVTRDDTHDSAAPLLRRAEDAGTWGSELELPPAYNPDWEARRRRRGV